VAQTIYYNQIQHFTCPSWPHSCFHCQLQHPHECHQCSTHQAYLQLFQGVDHQRIPQYFHHQRYLEWPTHQDDLVRSPLRHSCIRVSFG